MANITKEPKDTREGPRSFSVLMADLADGDFQQDASKELFDLIGKMRDVAIDSNSKVKGKLELKFDFAIDQRGVVSVTFDVKSKPPKLKRAPAMAWITKGGNLTLTHPKQLNLGIREVRDTTAEESDERRGAQEES